jgi:hypothetical protein
MATDKKDMTFRLSDDGWRALEALVEHYSEVLGPQNPTSVVEMVVRAKARELGLWGAPRSNPGA